jgi:uncharacterized protein GlcG (DUF336 family)
MITLKDARQVIAAAGAKAHELGQPMNIAVVDAGGNLVSHVRMDGAWIGSIDFDISTAQLSENSQPGQQFYGIQNSNHGRIMIFAGGVPLRRNGQVVGAIGVSGGSQDQAVATSGASAIQG